MKLKKLIYIFKEKLTSKHLSLLLLTSLFYNTAIYATPGFAYVVNYGNGADHSISAINLSTNEVSQTINLDINSSPYNITITPNGQFAYM